jgi:hypothetical protein
MGRQILNASVRAHARVCVSVCTRAYISIRLLPSSHCEVHVGFVYECVRAHVVLQAGLMGMSDSELKKLEPLGIKHKCAAPNEEVAVVYNAGNWERTLNYVDIDVGDARFFLPPPVCSLLSLAHTYIPKCEGP